MWTTTTNTSHPPLEHSPSSDFKYTPNGTMSESFHAGQVLLNDAQPGKTNYRRHADFHINFTKTSRMQTEIKIRGKCGE